MSEALPEVFRPAVTRLSKLLDSAERTGDHRPVVELAGEILSKPEIDAYPRFAATVRLERAHALVSDARGVTDEQAVEILGEMAAVRAALAPASPPLAAVVDFVEGSALLVLGTVQSDARVLTKA